MVGSATIPKPVGRRKGPVRRWIQRNRLLGGINRQIAAQQSAIGLLEAHTVRASTRQMDQGYGNVANVISLYGGERVASAKKRLRDLKTRRARVARGKPRGGFIGNSVRGYKIRRRVDGQIAIEEGRKRAVLKKVRAETSIWAKPLFEDRMPNKEETAAKGRYDVVNAEYEARKARIADLEKRRARVGRGGYWGGQPKRV